eukprot:jgi/Chrpa1/192/Chrysochromulina_OHIO_Genome00013675-RA
MRNATAARAGVDPSVVELTISPGSVLVNVSIQTTTAMAASVQSTMINLMSSPSSATLIFANVTGVSITVLAVVLSPTISNVAPPPPPPLTGPLAVETNGSIGIIIGVIVGVIIALVLVLALVFMRRRWHPKGLQAQPDEMGGAAQNTNAYADAPKSKPTVAAKAPEVAAPKSKPTVAAKAPEVAVPKSKPTVAAKAPEPKLAVKGEDSLTATFLAIFSPKPAGVGNVVDSAQHV